MASKSKTGAAGTAGEPGKTDDGKATIHLSFGTIKIFKMFLPTQQWYEKAKKPGAAMRSALALCEGPFAEVADADDDDDGMSIRIDDNDKQALKDCLTFFIDCAAIQPLACMSDTLHTLGIFEEGPDLPTGKDYEMPVPAWSLVRNQVEAMYMTMQGGRPVAGNYWYVDASDKVKALAFSDEVLVLLHAVPGIPEPEEGESQKDYDLRVAAFMDTEEALTIKLPRELVNIIADCIKYALKKGSFPPNRAALAVIDTFEIE